MEVFEVDNIRFSICQKWFVEDCFSGPRPQGTPTDARHSRPTSSPSLIHLCVHEIIFLQINEAIEYCIILWI